MLPDNDSSSFVLMVLYHQNVDISKELEIYLSQQSNKGGFSTYLDRKKLSNYLQTPQKELDGWLQEHICVSAVSYYLMERLNLEGNPSKDKLYDFLFQNQNQNGLWDSYWWTSPIYATSFIIQAYFINNTEINESISKAFNGLLSLQQNDGSFIDNHNTKSCFYTALAIIALCSNKTVFNEYQNEINLAIKWLLSRQTKDGSFISTYSLQLPRTSVLNPKKIKKWTKDNSQATNIITNDFMRLFTTSTSAKALDLYNKNGSK
jgi:squalene cyclase